MPVLPGGVPERPKGRGCNPVGSAYGGSNPPAPTPDRRAARLRRAALRAQLLLHAGEEHVAGMVFVLRAAGFGGGFELLGGGAVVGGGVRDGCGEDRLHALLE